MNENIRKRHFVLTSKLVKILARMLLSAILTELLNEHGDES